MGDGQCRRIRLGMRGPSAHQHGFRIDPESDGDQRQDNNDDNGSHGPDCRARIRRNIGRHDSMSATLIRISGRLCDGANSLLLKNLASAAILVVVGRRDDSTETGCCFCTNCCGSLLSDNALDAPDRTDSL